MREARLIGGVNLVDRAFNKKGRANPANYQKPRLFTRTFVEIPPRARARALLPPPRPPFTPRCADGDRGDTRCAYSRRLMHAGRLFIVYAAAIKGQLDGGRLIRKARVVKSRLPRRRRLMR